MPIYGALTHARAVEGIAIATAVAMSLQLLILVGFHSVRYHRHLWVTIGWSVLRGAIASLPGSVAAIAITGAFWRVNAPFPQTLVVAAGASLAWLTLTLPLLIALGGDAARPLRERLARIRDRIRLR